MKTQQFNKKKTDLESDLRTREYLNKLKNEIGLITFNNKWDGIRFETIERSDPWLNHGENGYVETGQLPDKTWIVEYAIRNAILDWEIFVMNFSRQPDREMISCAMLIEQITVWFQCNGWNKVYFNCQECGGIHHWLDTTVSFIEKWDNFQKHCCNCTVNQKAV